MAVPKWLNEQVRKSTNFKGQPGRNLLNMQGVVEKAGKNSKTDWRGINGALRRLPFRETGGNEAGGSMRPEPRTPSAERKTKGG